jgi:hypothetical protein
MLASTLEPAAEGRIGGSIQEFQYKNKHLLVFRNRSVKEDKVYYVFSLTSHPAQQHADPGFAGGMTVTTSSGKVLGESLAIRLGTDQQVGQIYATAVCMNLTYDAIGKPIPSTPEARGSEFKAYSNAIIKALAGLPQAIKYKGYAMRITVSKTNDNELLLAITPDQPAAKPAQ